MNTYLVTRKQWENLRTFKVDAKKFVTLPFI